MIIQNIEIAIVGIFVLMIMYGIVSASVQTRRSIAKLSQSHCPVCGSVYGRKAASDAPKKHGEECQQAQAELPTHKINFVNGWPVECPQCKSESYFDPEANEVYTERMLERIKHMKEIKTIHEAAQSGQTMLVRQYLKNDPALVNARDENLRTPLHFAAMNLENDAETVSLLLSFGADAQARDKDGWTAANWADFCLNLDAYEILQPDEED